MESKKLFLLDGMALIYRAYFALSKTPRITSYGLNTSAIMGFTNTLLEVLNKENPTHIAVVFDTAAPTQRHIEFEAYKAQRQAMPEDLAASIPYIFRLIEGFNIPIITLDGYEADDIIGTLAKKAEQKGYTVYCMTPDKDFAQLVSPNIFIHKPARMGNGAETLGVTEVLEKWEIDQVEQVIDILGLWGDAVDNIPGIPGIGEKTAKKLIKQFGSIEQLVESTDQLKGKLKENVITYTEQGLISKKLATILLDVPVDLDESLLAFKEPSKEVLEPLFVELEFRTLGKRVFGENFSLGETKTSNSGQMDLFTPHTDANAEGASTAVEAALEAQPFATIHTTPHEYHLVDTAEEKRQLAAALLQSKSFAFDTESTGLDPHAAELVGISFAMESGKAFYVPADPEREIAMEMIDLFKPALESPTIQKVGQNIKYDVLLLARYGVQVRGEFFDTMIAHYLLEPDSRHNMDLIAET